MTQDVKSALTAVFRGENGCLENSCRNEISRLKLKEVVMKKDRKIIGVCGARIFDQNAMRFLSELRKAGAEQGYFIIAFSANTDSVEDTDEILGERQLFELSGYVDFSSLIILTETLKNQKLIQRIKEIGQEKNIPVFSVDGIVDGCYNMPMDYSNGFKQMVRHVVEEHGARYVNMLAGFKGNSFSEERIRIYKEVLQEHGIPFEEERLGYGDFWDRPSRKVVRRFLHGNLPKPDAIICANDSMAITACSVLKEEGYKVPDDVIVTGFDGIQTGKYHTPMLATCEPDYREPMAFIFREIEKAEKTGKVNPCDCTVEFTITKNQSCGCKPKIYYDRNRIISTLFEDVGDCAWHNLAMNQMVTSTLDKQSILDIAEILPETVKMWSDHFHFVCVKSALLDSYEVPERYSEMVTILRSNNEEFEKPGEKFSVTGLIPRLEKLVQQDSGADVLVVRLLNSGKNVYGYIAEGFHELDDRRLQRCNEFAMFLSHSINTVLHNLKLNELNQNLTEAYNEISLLSIQDPMTGIYNRRGFSQKLEELLNQKINFGKYLYMISIDMDQLKYINDTFGHAEGDFAIITLANVMAQIGGKDTVCARFGGDEFTCAIISDACSEYQDKELSEKINQMIQVSERVSQKPYPITASVGISCCLISEEMDIEALIMSADKKMYQDKMERKKQRV